MFRLRRLYDEATIVVGAPLLLPYALSSSRRTVALDAKRWLEITRVSFRGLRGTAFLLGRLPEFRSLFYYRLGRYWRPVTSLLRLFYRPCPALYLATREIGPGLFIQHGFATIVGARRIGSNCWINQQVTVGYSDYGQPTIGNNVTIHSGAHVIGAVIIGDNAIVGAGAVVVKDVPPDCTVVGVPARIIRRNGVRCHGDGLARAAAAGNS